MEFGSLEVLRVSNLYHCQSLSCAPNSKSIAQVVDDVDAAKLKSYPELFLCDMHSSYICYTKVLSKSNLALKMLIRKS